MSRISIREIAKISLEKYVVIGRAYFDVTRYVYTPLDMVRVRKACKYISVNIETMTVRFSCCVKICYDNGNEHFRYSPNILFIGLLRMLQLYFFLLRFSVETINETKKYCKRLQCSNIVRDANQLLLVSTSWMIENSTLLAKCSPLEIFNIYLSVIRFILTILRTASTCSSIHIKPRCCGGLTFSCAV